MRRAFHCTVRWEQHWEADYWQRRTSNLPPRVSQYQALLLYVTAVCPLHPITVLVIVILLFMLISLLKKVHRFPKMINQNAKKKKKIP